MEQQALRGLRPLFGGNHLLQVKLNRCGIVIGSQVQPTGHPFDVRIDNNSRHPEHVPQEHIGRFPSYARQRHQRIYRVWHRSMKPLA